MAIHVNMVANAKDHSSTCSCADHDGKDNKYILKILEYMWNYITLYCYLIISTTLHYTASPLLSTLHRLQQYILLTKSTVQLVNVRRVALKRPQSPPTMYVHIPSRMGGTDGSGVWR